MFDKFYSQCELMSFCVFLLFFLSFHSMSANDLTFHFFGAKSDSLRVREAINKMVEKGRIGNFSLISTHYALHQEPGLILQVSNKNSNNLIKLTA